MMNMMITLQCRLALVQRLGLESEFFGSVLVRSEKLLKSTRYQRGLKLLHGLDEEGYRSVLDFLLCVFSPAWKGLVEAYYYTKEAPKLAELVEWETIDAIDQLIAVGIIELTQSYEMLEQAGWLENREPCELDCKIACAAVRMFLPPHFPPPPAAREAA